MDDTLYEQVNDFYHRWWMSSSIGQNPSFSCPQLLMKILSWTIEIWMRNHLVSDTDCSIVNLYNPNFLQGMTNNVGLTFNVGDTILWSTISIEEDNLNWWHQISYLVKYFIIIFSSNELYWLPLLVRVAIRSYTNAIMSCSWGQFFLTKAQ